MPKEVQVSPSCPQPGQTSLLSKSEPSLFITSLALPHLGHANPSCPQACFKNSPEPLPSTASTATGAVLEPPRLTGLLKPHQPPSHWQTWCHFLCRYPTARCQAHLGCIRGWDAGGSVGGQVRAPPPPPVLPKITLCPASRRARDVWATRGFDCQVRFSSSLPKPSGVYTRTSVKYSTTATGWRAGSAF